MKKLIIAAAIVCVAVISQGAQTAWGISNMVSSPDVKLGAGWMVQIFDAGVAYDYEKALAGEITATFTGYSTQIGTKDFYKAGATEGSFKPKDVVSLYAVVYDAATIGGAKNYIVSEAVTQTVPEGDSNIAHAFGNMAGTTDANKFLNSEWQSVPEPTSGLLLLLGVAGLSLRRRRA